MSRLVRAQRGRLTGGYGAGANHRRLEHARGRGHVTLKFERNHLARWWELEDVWLNQGSVSNLREGVVVHRLEERRIDRPSPEFCRNERLPGGRQQLAVLLTVQPCPRRLPCGGGDLCILLVRSGLERHCGVSIHVFSLALVVIDTSLVNSGEEQALPFRYTRSLFLDLLPLALLTVKAVLLLILIETCSRV